MARAILLPTPGDPFLLKYWVDNFQKIYLKEVDRLYVCLNTPAEKPVIDYILGYLKAPNIRVMYLDHFIDHGEAINQLLNLLLPQDEYIMLAEDDGFVFRPDYVSYCFTRIESGKYDVVAGKRGSCHVEILKAAQKKWGLEYEGEGDQGPNFWPCFFFCHRDLLIKETTRQFCGKTWKNGEVIDELDSHVVQADLCPSDTFVQASLQIRNAIPDHRIKIVPQYHGHPDDAQHFQDKKYLFDGGAFWCHIGSLSSGFNGVLQDPQGRPLARRLTAEASDGRLPKEWIHDSDFGRREWERRVQWWFTAYEHVKNETMEPGIALIRDLYRDAIQRIISQWDLSFSAISKRMLFYQSIGMQIP